MKTQTVVFTPPTSMTANEALSNIGARLPSDVINHMNITSGFGQRATSITNDGNTYTVVTEWDDEAAATYKDLMASVSSGVKADLISEGWTITFTPETADL
jgi:hypothetical protein